MSSRRNHVRQRLPTILEETETPLIKPIYSYYLRCKAEPVISVSIPITIQILHIRLLCWIEMIDGERYYDLFSSMWKTQEDMQRPVCMLDAGIREAAYETIYFVILHMHEQKTESRERLLTLLETVGNAAASPRKSVRQKKQD